MKKRRQYLIYALPVLGAVVLSFFARGGEHRLPFLAQNGNGNPYNQTLNAANSPAGLTNEYSDLSGVTITSLGNDVEWSYKEAKSSATGHVTLGKINPGNPTAEEAHIGNVTPITSVTNITVDFTGTNYLALFGSPDGETYFKLFTFDANNLSTENGNGYLYLRFVNAGQGFGAVVVNTISIDYLCDESDFSVESSDAINRVIAGAGYTYSSAIVHDATVSTHAMAITTKDQIFLDLGFVIPQDKLDLYMLEFYINASQSIIENGGRDRTRLEVKLANNTTGSGETLYDVGTAKLTDSWVYESIDMSRFAPVSHDINAVRIKIAHTITSGQVYVDGVRVTYKGALPEYVPSVVWPERNEANDLSNATPKKAYGTFTHTEDTVVYSPADNSTKSNRTEIDAEWRQWYYEGMGVNLQNKLFSFDIKFDSYLEGKTYGIINMDFILDDDVESNLKYSTGNITPFTNSAPAFVEITDLGDGWFNVLIDLITLKSSTVPRATSNFGFKQGNALTVYLDNIYIGSLAD